MHTRKKLLTFCTTKAILRGQARSDISSIKLTPIFYFFMANDFAFRIARDI